MRADGMTLQAIADTLNEEGVPSQFGRPKWRPSSVRTAAGYKPPKPLDLTTGARPAACPPARRRGRRANRAEDQGRRA